MRLKLILAFLTCLGVFAYVTAAKQQQTQGLEPLETEKNVQLTANELSTRKQQQWQEFREVSDSPLEAKPPIPLNGDRPSLKPLELQVKQPPQNPEPEVIPPISQENYMTLTPTNTSNALGNPIYELRLYAKGQLIGNYATVTGQATTQQKNRHQEGTEAPLPDGKYAVANTAVAGTEPEVGELFLPIQPLFSTGRTALGIHYDPSFQKTNGEDGTHGCIALTQKQDLEQVLHYIYTYQPQYLEVTIES
ncbi:L,D-transpeptidase [Crocosphaera sp. XPORK-15E]|uniref:L,D-transpeptidase n=1 Tax=Crocosphaera sp. XPORK-15E TaxID=3110247 RepID=UPI002B1F26C7|nr:L,D-transpeptidase [Crocosphaera sp. XPORK-15E]MEA5534194.1 L,D-transpeptidase [Crocosphaera sp. XPORK-15E]